MGCVGSKEDELTHMEAGSKPSTPSKDHPPSAKTVSDSLKPASQPLFNAAAAATSSAATAADASDPSSLRPTTSDAARRDARASFKKQASGVPPGGTQAAGAAAGGHDSDKDSDWDQCSTSHFNGDGDKEDAADTEPAGANASVMEKALGQSIYAEDKKAEADVEKYRETTTLRIDKVKGCMFVNQYLVLKFLGRGACGKVFLCLNTRDLHLYAMKAVRKVDLESTQAQNGAKKRNPMEDLKREIMIMKKMKHLNIVTLSEVIDDPTGSKLLLVMEFMEGGPVLTREALEKREKLPESMALVYFRDMVKALDYLHGHKVVHGDLKPENVLMSAAGDVKLSDFGCSKIFATGNEYLERCNGTPAFLAPEMMKPNTRYRGRPTDVYALGACLYTLLFGRIPFSAPNLYKLFQVVQNDPVKYPEDVPISSSLRNLLQAMLTKNPRERITLHEVMKHPWVTMDGRFGLRMQRDLREGETQEYHSGIVGGLTFQQVNPKPDFIGGLASLSRHERQFNEGDVIMRQGDTGTYLMYIVDGTVDVLVKWTPSSSRRQSSQAQYGTSQSNSRGPTGQPGGVRAGPNSIRSAGVDELLDDSETMLPILDEESRQHRSNLMRAAGKAREFVKSLQTSAGDTGSSSLLLMAQRSSGELIGEMALFSKSLARCATVRCRTRVIARIITHEQLVEFLMQQPTGKHQIREGIWRKESEIAMVEALAKLASVQDIVAASLESSREMTPSAPGSGGRESFGAF